ncbi:PHD-finger [Dictyocaulus viviparus]|uniref:PHD-finger n=1 Tax=Dictyocaulus viviparus TaxID=29172 RepID=A0A0D8YG26_DICVI|nr:PHD-finger [Dictyocaulus viviparus]
MQPPSSDERINSEDSNLSTESTEVNITQNVSSVKTTSAQDHDIDVLGTIEGNQPSNALGNVPSTPKSLARVISADVTHRQIEVKDLIEYEWPLKSGDKYFLQEQVGDLLDIKSFSRKFPEMSRRKVEKIERDWLCSTYNIHQIMNETQLRDLCAMRSVEIHDLMASEYPSIYQEFQRITAERHKALMAEQAKEMEAIKNDSKKMADLREKAMKSAADFNKELQLMKKSERQHYWDIQTSIIQSSTNKWRKLPAKYTKPDPYPVALIHGQYQSYYRRFTSAELRRLPLGSVLDGEHLFPVHRDPSPPPINVSDKDMQKFERLLATQQTTPTLTAKTETTRFEPARKSSQHIVFFFERNSFDEAIPMANYYHFIKLDAVQNESWHMQKTMMNYNLYTSVCRHLIPLNSDKDIAIVLISGSLSSIRITNQRTFGKHAQAVQGRCTSCDELPGSGEVLVKCVSCTLQAHATCLEMSDEMAIHVATYPWQCMECKRCSVCSLGDREESMMFCDRCDRGFHTHCIGMSEAPQGTWICRQYCNTSAANSKRSTTRKSCANIHQNQHLQSHSGFAPCNEK